MILQRLHPYAGVLPCRCCKSSRQHYARNYSRSVSWCWNPALFRTINTRVRLISAALVQGPGTSNRRGQPAVGRDADSWDAIALGAALLVPPPTARALAASLNGWERAPPSLTTEGVGKRGFILQQELGLTPTQVARMVSLQPDLLSCPIAALRFRAQQLAAGLSRKPILPHAAQQGRGSAPPRTPSSPALLFQNKSKSRTALFQANRNQPTSSSPTAAAPSAQPPTTVARPARHQTISSADTVIGDPADAHQIMVHDAMALIARQPALLEVPLGPLCVRSHQLASLLDVAPYDACLCLTRLPPEQLFRVLQSPGTAVRSAWRTLVATVAGLQWPETAAVRRSPSHSDDDGDITAAADDDDDDDDDADTDADGAEGENGDERSEEDVAGNMMQQQQLGVQSSATQGTPGNRDANTLSSSPRLAQADEATKRMVLLCPQLLLLPPHTLRASALHLHTLLGLSHTALRRLLARSPRLLLLPGQHRLEAMRALVQVLGLRNQQHAARLVTQQPNLLKWTPQGLNDKLSAMAAALGLTHHEAARLCRNQPALLAMSADSLSLKLQHLQTELRLPDADSARRLVLCQPAVLSLASEAVTRKLAQLVRVLELSGEGEQDANGGRTHSTAAASAAEARLPNRLTCVRTLDYCPSESELHHARQLVLQEPSLLTMNMEALPARLVAIAGLLNEATIHEARDAVLACPRLLVLQQSALRYRLRELAWGLGAPSQAVRALVRARPEVVVRPLEELREAVAAAVAAGVGRGLRGRQRVAAVLEYLGREPEY